MVLLIAYKNNAMKNIISETQDKVRTTLYLTKENNKKFLDEPLHPNLLPQGRRS